MGNIGVKHSRSATEEEEIAIARIALAAAHKALQPLLEDIEPQFEVLACVKAFRAAQEAASKATKDLRETTGEDVYCYPDIMQIVAAAVDCLSLPDTNEVHPYNVCSLRIVMLIRATKIMESLHGIGEAFLDDTEETYGLFLSEEANKFADQIIEDIRNR